MQTLRFLIAIGALAATAVPSVSAQCVGDCSSDSRVSVDEMIVGVRIALGQSDVGSCPAFDANHDGVVGISELTRAVSNAINGCIPSVQIVGGCTRPGPGPRGIVLCDAGIAVRALVCRDRRTCLHDPALQEAGATTVTQNGNWAMLIDADLAKADLVFEASIDNATAFRAFGIGTAGGGTHSRAAAGAAPMILLGPDSEAAVRVLDTAGLDNLSDAGIEAVVAAVASATSMIDYSVLASTGYSAAQAADLATLTALRDPTVLDTIEDQVIDPGTLPTRTPTFTPTPSPTPVRRFVYVTNGDSASVSVIETAFNTVVDTIDVGAGPKGIAITPDGRYALVVNEAEESVSMIDTATRSVRATIPLHMPGVNVHPFVVAVSPDSHLAYVTKNAAAAVDVLDLSIALTMPSSARIGSLMVGDAPLGIAVARTRPLALVADFESRQLSVLNTDAMQVTNPVPISGRPTLLALTHDDRFAYVTNQLTASGEIGSTVSVVDTALAISSPAIAERAIVQVGLQPTGVAVTPDDAYAYVVNSLSSSLSVIATETNTVVTTVPLLGGANAQTIAIAAEGDRAYVANCDLDSLSVIDTDAALGDPLNAVVTTVPVGRCPQGVAVVDLP